LTEPNYVRAFRFGEPEAREEVANAREIADWVRGRLIK